MKRLIQIGNRLSMNVDMTDPFFFDDPLCKHADPEAWFDESIHNGHLSSNAQTAIKICGTCKHEVDCAAYAIVNPNIVGIWGATTQADRKKIRKKIGINESVNTDIIDINDITDNSKLANGQNH